MNASAPSRIDVIIDDVKNKDRRLSDAVNHLIPAALEQRTGILVTRLSGSDYTVQVDAGVPCGTIHEKDH